MGARWIRCPVSTELVTFSACLDCAAHYRGQVNPKTGAQELCNHRYSYLHYLATQAEKRKAARISSTMLTGCLRQAFWNVHRDYALDPDKQMAAVGGTAWHDLMDQHPQPDTYGEQRLTLTTPLPSGRNFTGQFDRLIPVPKAHRTQPAGVHEFWIEDYKRKKEDGIFTSAPAHYAIQLNIYRFLIERGATNVVTGEILQGRVTKLTLLPSAHTKVGRPVNVPLIPLERIEAYLERCLAAFEQATPADPPPHNTEPTQSYFCQVYCPHYEPCRRIGGNPVDMTTTLFHDQEDA